MIQQILQIWPLVALPFLNPAWTSGSSQFMYCWNLSWWILSITFIASGMSTIVWQLEHTLVLPFLGIGMKTDPFQSCGYCWVFQICWHIECSTLTASSLRIWNSSAGIPSHPLALLLVIPLRSTWLCIPGCLTLGEGSHHHDYLGHEIFFV